MLLNHGKHCKMIVIDDVVKSTNLKSSQWRKCVSKLCHVIELSHSLDTHVDGGYVQPLCVQSGVEGEKLFALSEAICVELCHRSWEMRTWKICWVSVGACGGNLMFMESTVTNWLNMSRIRRRYVIFPCLITKTDWFWDGCWALSPEVLPQVLSFTTMGWVYSSSSKTRLLFLWQEFQSL